MKYFSLFSGIGGFELGIEKANLRPIQSKIPKRPKKCNKFKNELGRWECVGYSEIHKYAIQIYQGHFPTHKNWGDARKIIPKELPDFGLLVAGFPCQSFSIAGKRGGFKDTRGTLFFEIARIAGVKRPRYLLLENVQGLLSHDKSNTFATIIATLDELGYDCQWDLLNSKNFGVPQNRKRVFIVGHIRGTGRPKIFPIRESIGLSQEGRQKRNAKNKLSTTITQNLKRGVHSGGETLIVSRPHGFNKGGIKKSPCLRSCNSFDKNEMLLNETKIRRLTPTECERLQGFPDGWTEGVSDTQRYKCLGNAVTVNVIEAIIRRWQVNGEVM